MNYLRLSRRFLRATDGAIAIVFGLALTTFLLAIGFALDYARGLSIQTSLQADLDAAVLAAAARIRDDDVDSKEIGRRYFGDNWKKKHNVDHVDLQIEFLPDDSGIAGTAKAKIASSMMQIFGHDKLNVAAYSEVLSATQSVEVALVLDTTGSMLGTKIDALKTAAQSLIDKAYEATNAAEHVKISVVPFAQYVNVGMGNRDKPWMSVDADSSTEKESCGYYSPVIGTSNCRMETFTSYNDGVPSTYESEVCDYEYGEQEYQCHTYTDNDTWYGCAGSRDTPLDTRDESYDTPVPGVMDVTCGSELAPLTDDVDLLRSQIDALVATGNTYIPSGLFWGWTTLSPHEPFDEAHGYGEKVNGPTIRKVLVLMTDGQNTMSATYPEHGGSDAEAANTVTEELCTNVKAAGIDIFTVAFEIDDVDTKVLMRKCASNPSFFFDAADETELEESFLLIAENFSSLHLSK